MFYNRTINMDIRCVEIYPFLATLDGLTHAPAQERIAFPDAYFCCNTISSKDMMCSGCCPIHHCTARKWAIPSCCNSYLSGPSHRGQMDSLHTYVKARWVLCDTVSPAHGALLQWATNTTMTMIISPWYGKVNKQWWWLWWNVAQLFTRLDKC